MSEDTKVAAEILRSVDNGLQVPLFTCRPGGLSMTRAYRLSADIARIREERGESPVGRKIGFTNRTMWEEFNVSAPIFGPMYDSTVRPLGEPFNLAGLLQPRIEPEIAFRLAAPPRPGMKPKELMACVSGVCAGFEMVQSIFEGWRFKAEDAVAAVAMHGAFLHGPIVELSPDDREEWVARLAGFKTTLSRNREVVDEGHAENVLGGGPLVALGHLAELVGRVPNAPPLEKGEIVATGTLTRVLPVNRGETWHASFGELPLEAIMIELI